MPRGCGVAALLLHLKEALMGQYHHPVCIEAEEGLSPHSLGCGLKEGDRASPAPARVRWQIEVEAEMPVAAAEKARHYPTKPDTTATVFEVAEIHPYAVRRFGDPLTIDLSDDSLLSRYPRGAARARGRSVGAIPPRWRKR
jgi:hypothetical protein